MLFHTNASNSLTNISSFTRFLKPLSVARVRKVSFLILSYTSERPRATRSKYEALDTSCTRSSSFHIRGLKDGCEGASVEGQQQRCGTVKSSQLAHIRGGYSLHKHLAAKVFEISVNLVVCPSPVAWPVQQLEEEGDL